MRNAEREQGLRVMEVGREKKLIINCYKLVVGAAYSRE
jgi:hypothetical protein